MVKSTRRSVRDAADSLNSTGALWRAQLKATGKGPSLLESLERMLFKLCRRYVKLKEEGKVWEGYNPYLEEVMDHQLAMAKLRYEVRGLARAVAKIRLPYEDQSVIVKSVEKEFIRKAKNRE
jgi:hypothetical protein